jgi:hypothetical protein
MLQLRIKMMNFYKELEQVLDQFLRYHMNILLGDFNAKVGREGGRKEGHF